MTVTPRVFAGMGNKPENCHLEGLLIVRVYEMNVNTLDRLGMCFAGFCKNSGEKSTFQDVVKIFVT